MAEKISFPNQELYFLVQVPGRVPPHPLPQVPDLERPQDAHGQVRGPGGCGGGGAQRPKVHGD